MNNLDSMLKHNKDFAAQQCAAGTLMPSLPQSLPNVKAVIIGCADMRVDPSHVLGIKPGEAVVMRNIGGRITPGLLEQLGLLGRIGQVAGAIPGGGGEFHFIVLQHTDCGITRLANDPALLDALFSNTGRGTQDQSGIRSPRGGRPGRRFAPGGSCIAGRVAYFRPRLRRRDRTCRDRRTASADSYRVNVLDSSDEAPPRRCARPGRLVSDDAAAIWV
jgi:Carbonic anhydrase